MTNKSIALFDAVKNTTGGESLKMTSLELADVTNKRHDNVKRTIETLVESGAISLPQFEDVKIQRERREESIGVFVFYGPQGRLDSITVVAQLDPAFTAALVKRWDALETGKAKPAMVTAQDQGPSLTDASNSIIQMHGAGVIGKREAAAMYRAAMLSKFHGAGALLAASKPKPAKALPAPTQATLANGDSVPYELRAKGTKSATELLVWHNSTMRAKALYEVMEAQGMVITSHIAINGWNESHRVLVGGGLKYGQNVMNFEGTHSRPYFYADNFGELLDFVGLLVDATAKPTAAERALRDHKKIVKEAWNIYGGETSESANRDGIHIPYLTRSALIHYMTIDMGKYEKTANNFVAPKSDAMRALFKDGFLRQHKNGWLIFDGDSI